MSVIDIKSAYRAVPIRESHTQYLGFRWCLDGEELTLVDNRMCFGLRLGPLHFNCISDLILESLNDFCGLKVVNYLDDFIVIGNSYVDCTRAQNVVISLLRFLGFYVSYSKVTNPSMCTVYLGIEIDSVQILDLVVDVLGPSV